MCFVCAKLEVGYYFTPAAENNCRMGYVIFSPLCAKIFSLTLAHRERGVRVHYGQKERKMASRAELTSEGSEREREMKITAIWLSEMNYIRGLMGL